MEDLRAEGDGFRRRCQETGLTTVAQCAELIAAEEGLSATEVLAETKRLVKRWAASARRRCGDDRLAPIAP
ncbi:MAG: hypothetical protein ACRDJH_19875 [Thermomicrobiales bacterium]